MTKGTVIYPGTFDPITFGHADLVERAAMQFDRVIVAVAGSTSKSTLFTVEERMEMATYIFSAMDNVTVYDYSGLTVVAAQQHGAAAIMRGLRAVSDFEYELQLASMNRRLAPEVDTLFLTPALQYSHLSATMVREIAALGGDVSEFVHPYVLKSLKEKLRK